MKRFEKIGTLLIQIFILLSLFAIAFLMLAKANLIQLPGFMQSLLHTEPEVSSEKIGNNTEILDYIGNTPENSDAFKEYPTISVDNMNTLLNSLKPHSNFYWESISETYSDEDTVKRNCRSRISGNRYNVEILDSDGNIARKCVSDGVETFVTKYSGNKVSTSSYNAGIFDFYSDAGLISVDYFKDRDFTSGSCEIRLVENQQYKLVSVVYTYDRNGITVKNDYGISLDYGVVLFAQSYENDKPVFKQITTSIYPLTTLDDKLFSVN